MNSVFVGGRVPDADPSTMSANQHLASTSITAAPTLEERRQLDPNLALASEQRSRIAMNVMALETEQRTRAETNAMDMERDRAAGTSAAREDDYAGSRQLPITTADVHRAAEVLDARDEARAAYLEFAKFVSRHRQRRNSASDS
jgi:hypothetical protein